MMYVLQTMTVAKAEVVIKYALIVSAYAENVKMLMALNDNWNTI